MDDRERAHDGEAQPGDGHAPHGDRREGVAARRVADGHVHAEQPGPRQHDGEGQDGGPGDGPGPPGGRQEDPPDDHGTRHDGSQVGDQGADEEQAGPEGGRQPSAGLRRGGSRVAGVHGPEGSRPGREAQGRPARMPETAKRPKELPPRRRFR